MGFVDAHCHLSDSRIGDWENTVEAAHSAGIDKFLMAGVDSTDWTAQKEIHRLCAKAWTCFGIHPYRTGSWSAEECEREIEILKGVIGQAHALGETGLDFRKPYRDQEDQQVEYFCKQIELAIEHSKVLVLHIVQAHGKALEILGSYHSALTRGVMIHAFNGSAEVAAQYLDLGCYLSVGGAATYERNKKLRSGLSHIPHDRILLETDSPDQAPESWGDRPNSPLALFNIADEVANLRKEESSDLMANAASNFERLFHAESATAQGS